MLRQAIGFDWWCWTLLDPEARLPTRYLTADAAVDQAMRRFWVRLQTADGRWAVVHAAAITDGPTAAGGYTITRSMPALETSPRCSCGRGHSPSVNAR